MNSAMINYKNYPSPAELITCLRGLPKANNKHEHLRLALSLAPLVKKDNYELCEFGVATGNSLRFLANLAPNHIVHGFDSFEGLPEDFTTELSKGYFKTEIPKDFPANVYMHIGMLEDTVPFFAKQGPRISVIHIDADLFSSAACVLSGLSNAIKPGTVIVFDEFHNIEGWEDHEYKAFHDFICATKLSFQFVSWNAHRTEVGVLIL